MSKSKNKNKNVDRQDKHLVKIPSFSNGHDIETLYMYNNDIAIIENLDDLISLKKLYLQNNKIGRIENLGRLKQLKKLYLSKNNISVLEGLEDLKELEELHIEKQNLVDNIPLCFDPRTVSIISNSLKVLNIANNKLESISFLSPLKLLTTLDASRNDLNDIKDITETLRNLYYLKEVKFLGNPVTKKHRYKEDVITNAYHLEILDNKNISEISRNFIKRFEEGKLLFGTKPKINIADVISGLPNNYPTTLQKTVSASIIKESKCKLLEDISAFNAVEPIYLSWNMFPKRKPTAKPIWTNLKGHKLETQKNIVIKRSNLTERKIYE
ncbi:uncharacterized protein LOC143201150 isoform X2 [Rhynchophorus ferrugineus]|uniref:uncharacterized protein LOC143201150 isoform X2 n=1 Tax=Rhynchophorus ferrugineus TaxID=354439 RepID=UPI003FCEDD50